MRRRHLELAHFSETGGKVASSKSRWKNRKAMEVDGRFLFQGSKNSLKHFDCHPVFAPGLPGACHVHAARQLKAVVAKLACNVPRLIAWSQRLHVPCLQDPTVSGTVKNSRESDPVVQLRREQPGRTEAIKRLLNSPQRSQCVSQVDAHVDCPWCALLDRHIIDCNKRGIQMLNRDPVCRTRNFSGCGGFKMGDCAFPCLGAKGVKCQPISLFD